MQPSLSSPLEIHTHDRIDFRRCRRKWNWASPLRENLVVAEGRPNKNLWFGSGWHFAMEDYHGYHRFPQMRDAFAAYVYAHLEFERPYEWQDLLQLGIEMADYYTTYWLPRHDEYRTLWLGYNGQGELAETTPGPFGSGALPQLEVPYVLPIRNHDPRLVVHGGTLDGVMVDSWGRWWIKEIKTATRVDTEKLDTDPQVTAYCMAAAEFYEHEFEGVVYLQFMKQVPHMPHRNADGRFSTDKRQSTTYEMYRRALIDTFGCVDPYYHEILDQLINMDTSEGNKYIRVDLVRRSAANIENEHWKIDYETRDMLNDELPLYPSPTRDCSWDCDFKGPCLAADDGQDTSYILEHEYTPRVEMHAWRRRIQWPDEREPADVPLEFDWLVAST